MKSVAVDYANMLSPNLGGNGLDPQELEGGLAEAFREAYQDVEVRRRSGEMGFFSLPDAGESAGAVQELADGFGQWFENLVVLGIGGSALGTTRTSWMRNAGITIPASMFWTMSIPEPSPLSWAGWT